MNKQVLRYTEWVQQKQLSSSWRVDFQSALAQAD